MMKRTIYSGLLCALLLTLAGLGATVIPGVRAASATTPLPTPTQVIVTVVAGSHGATIWNGATGAWVQAEMPGVLFTITQRSTDGKWLAVTASDGATGWVATTDVIAPSLSNLPTQAIRLNPIPAPASTVAVEPTKQSGASIAPKAIEAAPASTGQGAKGTQPATQPTVATGLTGKLIFQGSYGGPIYLYQLATSAVRPLTTGYDPALSPDGNWVAFTREGGQNGLWLINVDGSGERKVFGEREGLRSPKWSPDGKYILFSYVTRFDCRATEDGCIASDSGETDSQELQSGLARVDVEGKNYRDIAAQANALTPDWSSGGIVYSSNDGLQATKDDANTKSRVVIFAYLQHYYQDPDGQPNNGTGGRILFQRQEASHWEIFSVNPDGSGLVALTKPKTTLVKQIPSNVAPAWSPDGRHIVYLSNRQPDNEAGAWGLWVMNSDGSDKRRLPLLTEIEYNYYLEQMVDWGP